MWPSKTHSKIYIFKLKLHSVREWFEFFRSRHRPQRPQMSDSTNSRSVIDMWRVPSIGGRQCLRNWAFPKHICVFCVNVFFTIGSRNSDLAAIPPGKYSYGRPASFTFSQKSWQPLKWIHFLWKIAARGSAATSFRALKWKRHVFFENYCRRQRRHLIPGL